MVVKAHALRNQRLEGWRERIVGRWTYRELAADRDWFHGWISFDAVTCDPRDGAVYCGLNSLDGDLLYRFDPRTERFESLNTQRWADAYDVKIHRTILRNPADGCLYFGTSMLHDMDQQQHAAGGKLMRFDPATGRYDLLDVPAPRLYLQSIAADWSRGLIYSFTYPAEAVYQTDIGARRSTLVAYVGNGILLAQPHNAVVDRHGWLWGTWAETRAWDERLGLQPVRLFKYHPDDHCLVCFGHGLPRWKDKRQLLADPAPSRGLSDVLAETRHQQDFGFCDSMAYDGGRYIYASTVAGVLSRIDTETGKVEKIANAIATGRFPALAMRDGILYGAGGMHGRTQLMRWDTRSEAIEIYPDLVDQATGERPARIHDLDADHQHRIYLGENDNHERSSFLWSVTLD
ncbi:MAG: hypothetical protein GEU99_17025 [Luteitalea sp.]|nr:hypothetical protein [Luteitalea sp.]